MFETQKYFYALNTLHLLVIGVPLAVCLVRAWLSYMFWDSFPREDGTLVKSFQDFVKLYEIAR